MRVEDIHNGLRSDSSLFTSNDTDQDARGVIYRSRLFFIVTIPQAVVPSDADLIR